MNLMRRLAHVLNPPRARPRITFSIKEWCARHPATSYTVLAPAAKVPLDPVHTVEPFVLRVFTLESTDVREKYLARIPNARLKGARGLLILPDGTLADEVSPEPHQIEHDVSLRYSSGRAKFKRGNYFSLMTYWGENYYHWIHDSLLSLHLVRDRLPQDTTFIVPAYLKPGLRDMLELVGLPAQQLVWFDGSELWELENLYFSPAQGAHGNDAPEADEWFREQFWRAVGITQPEAKRRVYVSRRKMKHARIVNESDLEPVLGARGFEIVTPEELTMREQVKLFAEAAFIAGPHGSGLTNILFAPSGSRILDIFDRGNPRYVFRAMTSALGQSYWYLQGELIPNPGQQFPDIRVDPQQVAASLDAMMELTP